MLTLKLHNLSAQQFFNKPSMSSISTRYSDCTSEEEGHIGLEQNGLCEHKERLTYSQDYAETLKLRTFSATALFPNVGVTGDKAVFCIRHESVCMEIIPCKDE